MENKKTTEDQMKGNQETQILGIIRRSEQNGLYYSTTASSLNKRPLGLIYQEAASKNGEKSALQNPATKKQFKFITSKIDSGVRKQKNIVQAAHQSDGLTAKRKDESFGRVATSSLAKFLCKKWSQEFFMQKIKQENQNRFQEIGTDFNYIDDGYIKNISHEVRLNKRPLTGKPHEKFGQFTQGLFGIDNTKQNQENSDRSIKGQSLQQILNLPQQNVILLDMRGEGVYAQKEYNQFHITGSVSFPHGWLNRYNHFSALQRFKNLDNKMIIVFMDNERHGTAVAKVLTEKGFNNVCLLTGGIQQFFIDYPELIEGQDVPDYQQFKLFVQTSSKSPVKK